jgi:hypothetical protein
MLKYDEFRNVFYKFIGTKDISNLDHNTQYRTKNKQKNGRPDLVLYSDQEYYFIEIKTEDTKLTKNQPKGYLKELSTMDVEGKYLYFILPKKYKYENELDERIKRYNQFNINTNILHWDEFFEFIKRNITFPIANNTFLEYFNLLKDWYGYEHIEFFKRENNKVEKKEMGKLLHKAEKTIYTIEDLLSSNGYKIKESKQNGELGFSILNNSNKDLGWFGIWFELWAKNGDIIIFTISSQKENRKNYNLFEEIFTNTKIFLFDDIEYKYVSYDTQIFNEEYIENDFVKDLIEKLKKFK